MLRILYTEPNNPHPHVLEKTPPLHRGLQAKHYLRSEFEFQHMKLPITVLIVSLFASLGASGQTQGFAYPAIGKGVATTFVTDYHSLGINSSALGWGTGYENKRFTTGSSEFAFGMYSDNLTADKLKNLGRTLRLQLVGNNPTSINWNQQQEELARYAQAGISIQADYNWAGFAFQGKRFGGVAFNIRESYQWYSKFNEQTTDILFRGKLASYFDSLTVAFNGDTSKIANHPSLSQDTLAAAISGSIAVPLRLSEITNGSSIKLLWSRSYNFGYGRKIIGKDSVFVLYGGIGGRFIQSMAMFNMESDDAGLRVYSSLSPTFNIDYGSIANGNTSTLTGNGRGLPPVVGNGYGIDLSTSVILFGKLRLAAAVNNIGSVTYTRNVYSVKDTLFGNLSIAGLADNNVTETVNQLLRDGGILTLVGEEKYVQTNAADFRLGGSLHPWKWINFGFDIVAPFNRNNPGSLQNAVVSFGGDIRPFKWLQLSVGYFGGGIYKNNIPVGINFILRDGAYEFGISSRDALTFFTANSNTISAAFGFARFRF